MLLFCQNCWHLTFGGINIDYINTTREGLIVNLMVNRVTEISKITSATYYQHVTIKQEDICGIYSQEQNKDYLYSW